MVDGGLVWGSIDGWINHGLIGGWKDDFHPKFG
jgi:hypothetical protein